MTIRHLKIFTAVADYGGMSKAAKMLHISQPSISQAVSELEKHYGVKLFERLSQKIYLTKEGELMLSFSRHILDSFDHMEAAMNRAVETTSLRIGCSVSVGTCLINDILDQAEKRIPECMISVNVSNSSEIERQILNNEVDLGIVEGILKSKDLVLTPVCKDEMVVVCGRDHWLAKERSSRGSHTLAEKVAARSAIRLKRCLRIVEYSFAGHFAVRIRKQLKMR